MRLLGSFQMLTALGISVVEILYMEEMPNVHGWIVQGWTPVTLGLALWLSLRPMPGVPP